MAVALKVGWPGGEHWEREALEAEAGVGKEVASEVARSQPAVSVAVAPAREAAGMEAGMPQAQVGPEGVVWPVEVAGSSV